MGFFPVLFMLSAVLLDLRLHTVKAEGFLSG
jgi:hypothetical protein